MTMIHRWQSGLMLLLYLCFLGPVYASGTGRMTPESATRGSLWLRSEQGRDYQPAPTIETQVSMDVSGMLARVHLRQTFSNPGRQWVEGVYVFPLPENAAVDHLRMHIGERVIEGRIKERQAARKAYEKAAQAGKRTSLVEQERPNIFTSSLANIAPGESISVEIEYQQMVHYADGMFRLRFPMVVGPRYIPGKPLGTETVAAFSGTGWAQPTLAVDDAARITPPVQHPAEGSINPLSLSIRLDAGIPLDDVTSSYHAIDKRRLGQGLYDIRLAEGSVPADRDFELVWQPQAASAPGAAWFRQEKDGSHYGLLMLVPPQSDLTVRDVSRDVVFVIDTSGSMHGDSIEQARGALLLALDRLDNRDRFNIVRFNHVAGKLFPQTQAANPANLAVARHYVRGLHADGGTEMLPALEMALAEEAESQGVRQVIFMTDGSVGNEQQLFQLIRQRLGQSRLFTIGIGSAPNSYFMRKAAEYGRGTFTYIGKTSEVQEKMSGLFGKLENPVLTDIHVELPPGARLEHLPRRIPDLYSGEPLLLSVKAGVLPDRVRLRGKAGEQDWSMQIRLEGGQQGTTLAPEWGRRQVAELMTRLHDAKDDNGRQQLRNAVVATALQHHLVSKYTSLVAVDVTPARERDELLAKHAMKTNLPRGWSYEHVFGVPGTATAAQLKVLAGLFLLGLASLLARRANRQAC